MSELGWVDFSSNERNKVKTLLAMLNEPGVLDELGIGQIRDAFADLLFPGISTIQTRAKYFILVPRILRDYQTLSISEKQKHKSPEKYFDGIEDDLAKKLVEIHPNNVIGIIGRTKIETGGVDRRPSTVYWNGLKTFGIIKTKLSLHDFINQLSTKEINLTINSSIHNEDSDDSDLLKLNNDIRLPDYQRDWKDKGLSIHLSKKEAEFLKNKFMNTPSIEFSIPAQLFKADLTQEAREKSLINNPNNLLQPIDVLTEILLKNEKIAEKCKERVRLANEFSLAMLGPHLRYNLLLAKNFETIQKYKKQYDDWFEKASALEIFRKDCDKKWLDIISSGSKVNTINRNTKSFLETWCQAMQNSSSNYDYLDSIVFKQAKNNKKNRSLLIKGVEKEQWVGLSRLDFRWSTAENILKDIMEGLNAKA